MFVSLEDWHGYLWALISDHLCHQSTCNWRLHSLGYSTWPWNMVPYYNLQLHYNVVGWLRSVGLPTNNDSLLMYRIGRPHDYNSSDIWVSLWSANGMQYFHFKNIFTNSGIMMHYLMSWGLHGLIWDITTDICLISLGPACPSLTCNHWKLSDVIGPV